ncbi:RHS repeat-associated core domain-containing protein [Providencia rettgeri]|uniref:RHS repeat-associated core domain-containing protein n=1 Tax=Providencia rettgeri TaxID=587 RepID=UPI00206A9D31|nr:RHS repeat-associated core domain-containing protein [Providencia rettgeri]UPS62054.1 RHS domain-containing protein [Providencia rettgeri]
MWQGLRLLQEQDINTSKHHTYCYEDHGSYTPLAVIVKQSGYRYYWHHCDINSAPLDVTNAQGNTVWSGKYERFGFVRSSPLSFYSDPERKMESFEQNLRYAGQYFDTETGLHFNTFRFYDPQIGRFIMPDPIGLLGRINLYQYAPNTLGWIDPWGLCRRGNAATKSHMDDVRDQFIRDNNGAVTHTDGGRNALNGAERPETYLKPLNPAVTGRKGGSYTDMTFTDAKGRTVYVQTVDKGNVNGMTQREWDNAVRITQQNPNAVVITVPKGNTLQPGALNTDNMVAGTVTQR